MQLVVGLGNPGPQYDGTRHNIGFEVVDCLAARYRFDAPRNAKNAMVNKGRIQGQDVLLVKPQTYMNRSGDSVGALARYYKVEPGAVIVVHDELDFVPGEVRLKPHGGAGGHNGLRSLIEHIGKEFPRIRMGVGKPASAAHGADYVLSRFDKGSRVAMDEAVVVACEAVEAIVVDGLAAAMNRFNQKAK